MGARSRSNIHSASPSVHMFLQRSASLLPSPNGFTASSVSCEMLSFNNVHFARLSSSSGLASYLALARFRSENSPSSAMISPPNFNASTLVLSAAGFIATSTRSEEHTSELQSLMRILYAVFCLKKQNHNTDNTQL